MFPTFGNCHIRSAEHVSKATVGAWVNKMLKTKVKRGSKTKDMSPETLRGLHRLLSSVLKEAVVAEPPLRDRNPEQRYGEPMLKKVHQLIESVNDTIKGQLDLEQHGRTFQGVAIRVAQRILAMATGIWHNNKTGATITRSLIAYDH